MLCYHGTSADNLNNIRKYGLKSDREKLWTVSHDAVYCWSKNLIKEECLDLVNDSNECHSRLFRAAYDSAFAALSKAKDCRAIIVIFEVDENELESDDSCGAMMQHANCIRRDIKPDEIKEIWVSNDLSLIRGYFIGLMLGRVLSNVEFSHFEHKIGEVFEQSEICFYDDFQDVMQWESLSLG